MVWLGIPFEFCIVRRWWSYFIARPNRVQAKPSLIYKYTKKGVCTGGQGLCLVLPAVHPLIYQLAVDIICVGIIRRWWILCIYNEARPNWVLEDIQRIVEGQYVVYHTVSSLANGPSPCRAKSTWIPTIQQDKLQSPVNQQQRRILFLLFYFILFIST